MAAFAVIAKVAVAAVQAVAAKVAVVAFLDVHTLVAELRFFRKCTVGTVAAYAKPKSIHAVFRLHMADDAVAVFPCRVVGAVPAVFAANGQNARMRAREAKRKKAFKEICHGSIISFDDFR